MIDTDRTNGDEQMGANVINANWIFHILFCPHQFLTLFCIWHLQLSCLLFGIKSEPSPIDVNRPGPDDQVDIIQLRDPGPDAPMMNALKPNSPHRWTKYRAGKSKYVIPYIIANNYSPAEKRIIRMAMRSISKNTCIVFRNRKAHHKNYVDIKNKGGGQGCYTMVGMVRGSNLVMLESSPSRTCITPQTVVHELLHKVGLWHEQMRYDRDKFIRVHYENIPPSLRQQFHKVPRSISTTYRVQYDYRSVMHYAKDAFAASPGKITMETKKSQFQNVIGTARKASKGDWRKVCRMYKCNSCMGKPVNSKINGQKRKTKGRRKKNRQRNAALTRISNNTISG